MPNDWDDVIPDPCLNHPKKETTVSNIEILHRPEIGNRFASFNSHDIRRSFVDAFGGETGNEITWLRPKGPGDKLLAQVDLGDYRVDLPELGGDLVPRVWLRQSNEGDQALTVGVGLFRFLCMNGLYFGVNVFSSKIRHIMGPKATTEVAALPGRLLEAAQAIQSGELYEACFDALSTHIADPVSVVGNLPGINLRAKDAAITAIINETHRAEDNPRNAWGLYQLLNELNRKTGRSLYRQAVNDVSILENIQILAESYEVNAA